MLSNVYAIIVNSLHDLPPAAIYALVGGFLILLLLAAGWRMRSLASRRRQRDPLAAILSDAILAGSRIDFSRMALEPCQPRTPPTGEAGDAKAHDAKAHAAKANDAKAGEAKIRDHAADLGAAKSKPDLHALKCRPRQVEVAPGRFVAEFD